jgi:hypothetical protein
MTLAALREGLANDAFGDSVSRIVGSRAPPDV